MLGLLAFGMTHRVNRYLAFFAVFLPAAAFVDFFAVFFFAAIVNSP